MTMKCSKLVEVGRRQFLRGGVIGAAGAAAATFVSPSEARAQALALVDYPANRLANIADLAVNEPMDVTYPDEDSPGVLLKLGKAVAGMLPEVFVICDAAVPGKISRCISDAVELALKI